MHAKIWTHYQPQKKSPSTSNHIASITLNNSQLEEFTYLESAMNTKLFFNKKIARRISRTASTLARLGTSVLKVTESLSPNTDVLSRYRLPNIFTILLQSRLWWLGHVRWKKDGRIFKPSLYVELISDKRNLGPPQLYYRGVCKRDIKELNIDLNK